MRNIKLTLEYLGTGYAGFQKQKNEKSIAGELEVAVEKLVNHPARVIGAGRTDAGVHALGQVANFKTLSSLETIRILKGLNALLPDDISVIQVDEVDANFDARRQADWRRYIYRIFTRKEHSPLNLFTAYHYPHALEFSILKATLLKMAGSHDFSSFTTFEAKKTGKTQREIYHAEARKEGDFILIEITANAFLHHMMRFISGALLAAASGKIESGLILRMLEGEERPPVCRSLPARGLFLVEVGYDSKPPKEFSNPLFF